MSKLKLSRQGEELLRLYKQMADKGYSRTDGVKVKKAFRDRHNQINVVVQ